MARRERRRRPSRRTADRPPSRRRTKKSAPHRPRGPAEAPLLARPFVDRGVVLSVWGVISTVALVVYYASQLPPIDQLTVPKRPPNIAIVAEDGTLIANRGDIGGRAAIGELPPYLPKAFVAIEDRRFYDHIGIDALGIARALFRDISGWRGIAGRLDADPATGQEPVPDPGAHAVAQDPGGDPRGLAGAPIQGPDPRALSQPRLFRLRRLWRRGGGAEIFRQERAFVSLPEAAMLAGLMQSPSRLSPNRNLEAAKARRPGHHGDGGAGPYHRGDGQVRARQPRQRGPRQGAGSVNYAADYVMDVLDDTVGAIDDDIVVTTTLDPKMQAQAERALTDELNAKGAKFGVEQGALVTLEPDGAVKALVGGRNYADSQFNRASRPSASPAPRSSRSSISAALENGLTPDTVREDAPITVKGWNPENYSRDYSGPVTLTKALALSLNTVAVRLGMEVGPKAVVARAHRLGITSDCSPTPPSRWAPPR